jgi:acyl carrier protein
MRTTVIVAVFKGVFTMTRAEIETKVIDIVSTQLGVDKSEVKLESSFANDLNADSLDTVELVMELEDAFSTDIPDDKAEQIQTVGSAVDFIVEASDTE